MNLNYVENQGTMGLPLYIVSPSEFKQLHQKYAGKKKKNPDSFSQPTLHPSVLPTDTAFTDQVTRFTCFLISRDYTIPVKEIIKLCSDMQ